MKLSAKARYAVTALADLATQRRDEPVPLAQIAQRNYISQAFLEQLFKLLRKAQLVHSMRGARGGYILARAADEIAIADIVLAIDEPVKTIACTPGLQGGCTGGSTRCLTHDLWDELGRHIDRFLVTITLADIIGGDVAARSRDLSSFATASAGGGGYEQGLL